jgi:hypothetical protein
MPSLTAVGIILLALLIAAALFLMHRIMKSFDVRPRASGGGTLSVVRRAEHAADSREFIEIPPCSR